MEFRELIIGFILIGLCTFSFLTFISLFSSDTGSDNIVDFNPSLNKTFGNLSKQMADTQQKAEASSKAFSEEGRNAILTAVGFVFQSLLDLVTIITNSVIGFFYIYFNFFEENLGIHPIITGTFTSILLITIILSAWRTLKSGEWLYSSNKMVFQKGYIMSEEHKKKIGLSKIANRFQIGHKLNKHI